MFRHHLFGASGMPPQPRLPAGFKRWPGNRKVSKVARNMAVQYLSVIPMGGYATKKDTDGITIAAFKDWHFDNHPKGGGPAFWHPGISMLVSTAKPKLTYEDIPWAPMSYSGDPCSTQTNGIYSTGGMYSGWG